MTDYSKRRSMEKVRIYKPKSSGYVRWKHGLKKGWELRRQVSLNLFCTLVSLSITWRSINDNAHACSLSLSSTKKKKSIFFYFMRPNTIKRHTFFGIGGLPFFFSFECGTATASPSPMNEHTGHLSFSAIQSE